MQPPELQQAALAWLPGTGPVRIERLGRGLNHDTFLATRAERRYSLRVAIPGRPVARLNAAFEARVLVAAATVHLAPPPIYCDVDRGVLALAWIDGQPWSENSIRGPQRMADVAQLVRRVQCLSVPPPWRMAGPLDWIAEYRRGLDRGCLEHLRGVADRHLAALACLPRVADVLCHSDLHRLNLLEVESPPQAAATLLLDWEYVHMADPLWDLAGWSANNDFSAQQAALLLTEYVGAAPGESDRRRFALLRWLFDYVCLLWISLYLTSVARGTAPQLAARARLLETRLAEPVYGKLAEH